MKNIKLAMVVACFAIAGVASALWVLSYVYPWTWTHISITTSYHVVSREGKVSVASFSTEAEDAAYQEKSIRYWQIESVALPLAGLAGWWIWKNRKRRGAGFPVRTNQDS